MSATSLLKVDSFRLDLVLKAQQTPESVMTGRKMVEQLTGLPAQEHLLKLIRLRGTTESGKNLSMWGEPRESWGGEQGRKDCHSRAKRWG